MSWDNKMSEEDWDEFWKTAEHIRKVEYERTKYKRIEPKKEREGYEVGRDHEVS